MLLLLTSWLMALFRIYKLSTGLSDATNGKIRISQLSRLTNIIDFSNTGSKLVESLGEMYRMLALLRFKIDVQPFNRLLNTNAISYRYHNSCTNKNIILSGLSPLSVSYFGCPVQVRIEKIALHRASAVPLRFAPKTICSSDRRLLSQTCPLHSPVTAAAGRSLASGPRRGFAR